jgi:hypothetical protein
LASFTSIVAWVEFVSALLQEAEATSAAIDMTALILFMVFLSLFGVRFLWCVLLWPNEKS